MNHRTCEDIARQILEEAIRGLLFLNPEACPISALHAILPSQANGALPVYLRPLVFYSCSGINFTMQETKETLRKKMAILRPTIASGNPQAILLQSTIWAAAQSIAIYSAIRDEAPTALLLEASPEKNIYLPAITNVQQRSMEFLPADNPLQDGPFHISQPTGGTPATEVDLLIVPGLAFDRRGSRLGFGGGFYDRFFQDNPGFAKITIGLCYTGQIVPALPKDPWDLSVNALCTEEGILWV